MRDIATVAADLTAGAGSAVVARAISVSGFGGRRAGEAVAVDGDGKLAGALLGGAADASIAAAALSLTAEQPTVELAVPIGDREAVASGLACGGLARLLVQDVASVPESVWAHLRERRPVAVATMLPPEPGSASESRPIAVLLDEAEPVLDSGAETVPPELRAAVIDAGTDLLRNGKDAAQLLDTTFGTVFLEAFVPPSRLVLVAEPSELRGAIVAQAALLGWEAEVHDDSAAGVDAIEDLGSRDAVVVLSHDPELDTPALAAGVTGRGYVGALGSRHTQQARRERLAALGIGEEAIGRIHGPIGLDIGSRTPEETAVSIFAEILAWRSGRGGRSLREGQGPING